MSARRAMTPVKRKWMAVVFLFFGMFVLLMDAVLAWSVVCVLRGKTAFDRQEKS